MDFIMSREQPQRIPGKHNQWQGKTRAKVSYSPLVRFGPWEEAMMALKNGETLKDIG